MYKNPFVVLGISENATQAEATDAYYRLKNQYNMTLSMSPEDSDAKSKLAELEAAYSEVMSRLQSSYVVDDAYANVQQLIKQKRLDEAQAALDRMSERGAEWHYYQSAVYHEKGWLFEAKSQLEMAMNMDPGNAKYKKTMERMQSSKSARGANNANANAGRQRSYDTYEDMQARTRRSTASDCCTQLICADCCCECMGGDLIRCC